MAQSHLMNQAYRKSQNHADIHPVKLIFMMYERVISHLDLAIEGVEQNDPKIRGENLSRAIAIITELNASIKEGDEGEAAQFLRGLYSSILTELPRVAVSNDLNVLVLAKKYMVKMKVLWQETAMEEAGFNKKSRVSKGADEYVELKPLGRDNDPVEGGGVDPNHSRSNSQRLSVAI